MNSQQLREFLWFVFRWEEKHPTSVPFVFRSRSRDKDAHEVPCEDDEDEIELAVREDTNSNEVPDLRIINPEDMDPNAGMIEYLGGEIISLFQSHELS